MPAVVAANGLLKPAPQPIVPSLVALSAILVTVKVSAVVFGVELTDKLGVAVFSVIVMLEVAEQPFKVAVTI